MLQSERLSYELITGSDTDTDADADRHVQRLVDHWNRPDVRRFLWDDEEVTAGAVQAALDRIGTASRFGGGLWLLSVDTRFVGTCALIDVFDEVEPLLRSALDAPLTELVGSGPLIEVIYSLEPEAWGNGYALEATRAMLDYGHSVCGLKAIFGGTDVPNQRSERTLRSADMAHVANFDGDAGPLIYFVSIR